MRPSELRPVLSRMIEVQDQGAEWAPLLVGAPGVGKTTLVKEIASSLNYSVVVVPLSFTDPSTLSAPIVREGGVLDLVFSEIFFSDRNVVFFDEVDKAPPSALSVLLSLLAGRTLGGRPVTSKFVLAANDASFLSTLEPLKTRVFVIPVEPPTVEEWAAWASVRASTPLGHAAVEFWRSRGRIFENDGTDINPRRAFSVVKLCDCYNDLSVIREIVAATISESFAADLYLYLKNFLADRSIPDAHKSSVNEIQAFLSSDPSTDKVFYFLSHFVNHCAACPQCQKSKFLTTVKMFTNSSLYLSFIQSILREMMVKDPANATKLVSALVADDQFNSIVAEFSRMLASVTNPNL